MYLPGPLAFWGGPHSICGVCISLNKSTTYLTKNKKTKPKNETNEHTKQNRNTLTDTENKLVVARKEGGLGVGEIVEGV